MIGPDSEEYKRIERIRFGIKNFRAVEVAKFEERIAQEMDLRRVELSNAVKDAVAAGMSKKLARAVSGRTSAQSFRDLLELTPNWTTAGNGIDGSEEVKDYGLYVKKYRGDEDSHTFGWNVNDKELVAFLSENPEAETAENFNEQTAQIIYGGNASAYWHHPDRAEVIRQMREVVKEEQ